MATPLHDTFKVGCYYTDFDKLPAAAQAALRASVPEVEYSDYTVYQHAGFLRAEVEIDGEMFEAEISFGDLSPEDWRPENDAENDENDCEYAEAILNELIACSELENTTVYLTRI